MIENGKCVCKAGHRKNSFGYCEYIKCAYDEKLDLKANKCVAICLPHQYYD